MKRKFTFLIAAMALMIAIMGPGAEAWGQKITSVSNIVSGKTYYIGATNGSGTDYYFKTTYNQTSTSVAGTAVTDKAQAVAITFTKTADNWILQFDNGFYLGLKNGKDNGKVQILENSANWTITNQTNKIRLTMNGFSLQKNNSGTQFGSYANTQTDVWLEEAGPSQLTTPTNFTATPGNTQATFNWTAVQNASSYMIAYKTSSDDDFTEQAVSGGSTTSYTLTGLTNDTEYTCKIKAVGDGTNYTDSDYSNTLTVTPIGATFYTVTISDQIQNGSVTANPLSATEGTEITLTATPAAGYTFNNIAANWSVSGTSGNVEVTPGEGNTATFTMPGNDVNVSATFTELSTYTITCTTPENGTLSTNPTNGYSGTEVTITATPNSGYALQSLTASDDEGNITITDNKFNIRNSDVTVSATFEVNLEEWILTDISAILPTDVVVITMMKTVSSVDYYYAMSNNNGTSAAPTATSITVSNNKITGDVADINKWNLTYSSGNITIYPNGDNEKWLYCTNTNNGVRIGTNTEKVFTVDGTYLKHTKQSRYVGVYNDSDFRCYTSNGGNIANQTLKIFKKSSITQVATPTFSVPEGIYPEAQSVEIACSTVGATIHYTLDGTTPTSSSAIYSSAINVETTTTIKAIAVKNGLDDSEVASATYTISIGKIDPTNTWSLDAYTATIGGSNSFPTFSSNAVSEEGATVSYTSSNTDAATIDATTGEISLVAVGTTTITANTTETTSYLPGSASYILTVKNAPLSTMDAIFAKAAEVGSTATSVEVTFNNWVISGVNGSQAFLTDGTKGLIIYGSSHGFEVGDILSGTVSCKVQKYQGSSELTTLTSSSEGLTVITGGVLTPVTMTIDEITSGVYTGAVIKIENVLYNGTNLSDGTNTIKPYNKLYSEMSFENGTYYNVTGVYLQFNDVKEIMPRDAADIEELEVTEYAINLNQTTGGTISADKATAAAGVEVTLSYVLSDGYVFDGWTVLDDELEEVTVEDNVFTMPESNVVVEATFNQVPTYTINYTTNGIAESETTVVNQGNPIGTLATPTAANIPNGYVFRGWSANEVALTDVEPTYVLTTDVPTGNMNLKAVFAIQSTDGVNTLVKMQSTDVLNNGDKIIIVATVEENDEEKEYAMYQETVSTSYVNKYEFDHNIETVLSDDKNWLTVTAVEGSFKLGDATNGYIYNSSNNLYCGTTEQVWTIQYNGENEAFRFASGGRYLSYRYDLSNKYWRMGGSSYGTSGMVNVDVYKISTGTTVYSNFCTSVTALFGTLTSSSTEANTAYYISGTSTVSGDVTINGVLGNANASLLTINDGGQLILNNAGVMATAQKHVEYSAINSKESNTTWYSISSPLVANVEFEDVENLIPTSVIATDYDLYRLNEAEGKWENTKISEETASTTFTTIDKGRGYIYSRHVDGATDIAFAGEINVADVECTLTNSITNGFNLIGNPFMQNIALTNVESQGTAVLASGFYVLNHNNSWETKLTSGDIKPLQGFLVQATTAGKVTINKPTSGSKDERSEQNANIEIIVSNSNYSDNAYAMFSDGIGLNKISHRNADAPMVYIPQNSENFAIAMMDESVTMFPLNFKAMTTGFYTISLKSSQIYEGYNDFDYLHLIDNMTGEEIDMLLEDGYKFVGSPRDNEGRFTVKLHRNGVEENEAEDINFVYQNGNSLVINGEGTFQLINMLGRVVISKEIHGETVSVDNLITGAYIVRMIGNEVKTQKIVIK